MPSPTSAPSTRSRVMTGVLVVSVALIACHGLLTPTPDVDVMNALPAAASLALCVWLATLEESYKHWDWLTRATAPAHRARRPAGAFLASKWFRSILITLLIALCGEFVLRGQSLHRALQYAREGNLLYAPMPSQVYVEKASGKTSYIDKDGLRLPSPTSRPAGGTVLCLGDSVTYGFGLADEDTWPAVLARSLEKAAPGQFAVANAGVDAYPMALENERFLALWERGIHPDAAIVGYSFNEGGLGLQAARGTEADKDKVASRIALKNKLRSIALYTFIVEDLSKHYYDRLKWKMVPGTNFASVPGPDAAKIYNEILDKMVKDLRDRNVRPIFLLLAGFNADTGRFNDKGPFQTEFANNAVKNGIPLVHGIDALAQGGDPEKMDLSSYFMDHAHFTQEGARLVGESLVAPVREVLGR